MNISETLMQVIEDLRKGKPYTVALSKDDLQRVAFVSLSQLYAAVEDLKTQLNAFELKQQSEQKSSKKWRD